MPDSIIAWLCVLTALVAGTVLNKLLTSEEEEDIEITDHYYRGGK